MKSTLKMGGRIMFDRHIADVLPVAFEAFCPVPERESSDGGYRLIWTAQPTLEFSAERRSEAVTREQLVLVRPHADFSLRTPNLALVRSVRFRSPLLDTFPLPSSFLVLNVTSLGKRLLALVQSYRERTLREGENLRLSSLLFSLICDSFLSTEAAGPTRRPQAAAKSVQRKKKSSRPIVYAVRYMRKHLANPDLSLQEIAGAVGYNPNYFCQEFSQIFGVSPIRHLNELRIARALRYLEDGDEPIKRICEKVGIRNPGNFTGMIKHRVGMTPLEYRRSRRAHLMDDDR